MTREDIRDDDAELAEAIRASGKVVLASYFLETSSSQQPIRKILATQPALSEEQLAQQLGKPIEQIKDLYVELHGQALDDLMEKELAARPDVQLWQILSELLPQQWWDSTDYNRKLSRAFDHAQTVMAAARKAGWELKGQSKKGKSVKSEKKSKSAKSEKKSKSAKSEKKGSKFDSHHHDATGRSAFKG